MYPIHVSLCFHCPSFTPCISEESRHPQLCEYFNLDSLRSKKFDNDGQFWQAAKRRQCHIFEWIQKAYPIRWLSELTILCQVSPLSNNTKCDNLFVTVRPRVLNQECYPNLQSYTQVTHLIQQRVMWQSICYYSTSCPKLRVVIRTYNLISKWHFLSKNTCDCYYSILHLKS